MANTAAETCSWTLDQMSIDAGSNPYREKRKLPVSGRARSLLYGPYSSLHAGLWTAVFTLSVDKWAYIYTFRVEFGAGADYTEQYVRFPAPGRYVLKISKNIINADPCEFRLILTEGALQGELTFESLLLFRE